MTLTKGYQIDYFNDDLEAMFDRIKNERATRSNKKVFGLNGKSLKDQPLNSEYVFLYKGRQNVDNFKKSFKSAKDDAGIEDFYFHDLRHTFASQVFMKSGSLKDIQELLGHKTMTMTLRYAHLTQEHKKRAVNLLNGLTGSTVPKNLDCHKTVTFPDQRKSASL